MIARLFSLTKYVDVAALQCRLSDNRLLCLLSLTLEVNCNDDAGCTVFISNYLTKV